MGLDDKIGNKTEDLGGKAKEATGNVTGDDSLKKRTKAPRPKAASPTSPSRHRTFSQTEHQPPTPAKRPHQGRPGPVDSAGPAVRSDASPGA